MLELIFIRHGETDSNIRNTYLGWTDIPLNEKGKEQAQHIAKKIKDENIDAIYSSPLNRTIQTAEFINKYHNQEVILLEGLKERNFGIWEDYIYADIKSKHTKLHDEWVEDWINFKIPEGESAREAYDRVCKAIDDIILLHKDGKVVIVSHLGCIRNSIAYLFKMGIRGSWNFRLENATITRIQITDSYPVLVSFNERNENI